jgi:hypothetical protein
MPNFSIRHDLLAFIDYVADYEVKRSHRENLIGKTDLKRLEKLIPSPEPIKYSRNYGSDSYWIEFISRLALRMELVIYDIEGQYMGYSSREPSFPDNYIKLRKENIRKYELLSSAEKELAILNALLSSRKY